MSPSELAVQLQFAVKHPFTSEQSVQFDVLCSSAVMELWLCRQTFVVLFRFVKTFLLGSHASTVPCLASPCLTSISLGPAWRGLVIVRRCVMPYSGGNVDSIPLGVIFHHRHVGKKHAVFETPVRAEKRQHGDCHPLCVRAKSSR